MDHHRAVGPALPDLIGFEVAASANIGALLVSVGGFWLLHLGLKPLHLLVEQTRRLTPSLVNSRASTSGVANILPNVLQAQLHAMTRRISSSLHPTGVALGMRWLVLIMIMFGTIISPMGDTRSHGLAAIAVHAAPSADEPHADAAHTPVHEDQVGQWVMLEKSPSADHPHHETDHSHDKAHAPSAAWNSAAAQPSSWTTPVRPSIEMVRASRLERPPKG